jgi:hypothetical protein
MGGLDKRLYTSPHASTDTVSRVGPDRVVRSQRWHVAERSETEFIELYASTTPMHSSHCITPHTYPSTGRTCTHSVSAIDVEHLLLRPVAISGLLRWLPSGAYHGCMWVGYCAERFLTMHTLRIARSSAHLRVPIDPARSQMPRNRLLPAPPAHLCALLLDVCGALHTKHALVVKT